MGLGVLGRGVGDVRFLAENGADLIVTDLKSEKELAPSLLSLKWLKNVRYSLGGHRLEDFKNRDFILKAAGVPKNSIYIDEAKRNGIPIEMSTSLFAKLTQATLIGITGTRGKSTTTQMLFNILEASSKGTYRNVFLGGNVRGISTLPLLEETKKGDVAVLELDSWQLQGFGEAKISPHISLFTTFFADHQNYYKHNIAEYFEDKANIFKYQSKDDILIIGNQVYNFIQKYPAASGTVVVAESLPHSISLSVPGEHNRENASLAREAAIYCGVSEEIIRLELSRFRGVPGRLEFIKEKDGILFYNDTTATTPEAVIAAIRALRNNRNIILIAGGSDKELDMSDYFSAIKSTCKAIYILPGTGSEKNMSSFIALRNDSVEVNFVDSMQEAVLSAFRKASHGNTVLLSPGFASFGLFENEFHRGDEFVKFTKQLP